MEAPGIHYELRDLASGELIAEYDPDLQFREGGEAFPDLVRSFSLGRCLLGPNVHPWKHPALKAGWTLTLEALGGYRLDRADAKSRFWSES